MAKIDTSDFFALRETQHFAESYYIFKDMCELMTRMVLPNASEFANVIYNTIYNPFITLKYNFSKHSNAYFYKGWSSWGVGVRGYSVTNI